MKPKVSVIIPCYNAVDTLKDAVASVPIAIYRYNWDRNPDSLSKRFNRGELPRERSK